MSQKGDDPVPLSRREVLSGRLHKKLERIVYSNVDSLKFLPIDLQKGYTRNIIDLMTSFGFDSVLSYGFTFFIHFLIISVGLKYSIRQEKTKISLFVGLSTL